MLVLVKINKRLIKNIKSNANTTHRLKVFFINFNKIYEMLFPIIEKRSIIIVEAISSKKKNRLELLEELL